MMWDDEETRPEGFRRKMPSVEKEAKDSETGQIRTIEIDVAQLAEAIYGEYGLSSRGQDSRDILNDIIQQMNLIIVAAEDGHTESYYRAKAYWGVKNFVQTGAFNEDNVHFASRKGWDAETRQPKLDIAGHYELSNLFYGSQPHEEEAEGAIYYNEIEPAGIQYPGLIGRQFAFRNRGHWVNKYSPGVNHGKYKALQANKMIGPSEARVVKLLLEGESFEEIFFSKSRVADPDSLIIPDHVVENLWKKARDHPPYMTAHKKTWSMVRRFIQHYTNVYIEERADLLTIRLQLRAALRAAVLHFGITDWKSIIEAMSVEEENALELIHEEFVRILFQAAGDPTLKCPTKKKTIIR